MIRQIILGVTLIALSACDKVSSPTSEESTAQADAAQEAANAAAAAAAGSSPEGTEPSQEADSSTSGAPSDQQIKDWVVENSDRLSPYELVGSYMPNWLRIETVSIQQRGEVKGGYYPVIVSASGFYNTATLPAYQQEPSGSFHDRPVTIFFKKDPFGGWSGVQSVNGQMPQGYN